MTVLCLAELDAQAGLAGADGADGAGGAGRAGGTGSDIADQSLRALTVARRLAESGGEDLAVAAFAPAGGSRPRCWANPAWRRPTG